MSKINSGVVTISTATGPVMVTVSELSLAGEMDIINMLRARAKQFYGPSIFYKNIKAVLDDKTVDEEFKRELRTQAAANTTSGAAVHDDAVVAFRISPEGVALEMFLRSRNQNSEILEKEFQTIINLANASQVRLGMLEALNPKDTDSPNS